MHHILKINKNQKSKKKYEIILHNSASRTLGFCLIYFITKNHFQKGVQ